MRLFNLTPSSSGRIRGFATDLADDFCRRLRELGFCEGASVQLVRAIPFGGPRVFRVSDAIFSIESDVSRKILIDLS